MQKLNYINININLNANVLLLLKVYSQIIALPNIIIFKAKYCYFAKLFKKIYNSIINAFENL